MDQGPPPEFLALFAGIAIVQLIFGAISVAALVFWIVALVDVCKRDFAGENEKLIWILVVVLANWIGALVYWYVGRPKQLHEDRRRRVQDRLGRE